MAVSVIGAFGQNFTGGGGGGLGGEGLGAAVYMDHTLVIYIIMSWYSVWMPNIFKQDTLVDVPITL